jgi:hypothetical protein
VAVATERVAAADDGTAFASCVTSPLTNARLTQRSLAVDFKTILLVHPSSPAHETASCDDKVADYEAQWQGKRETKALVISCDEICCDAARIRCRRASRWICYETTGAKRVPTREEPADESGINTEQPDDGQGQLKNFLRDPPNSSTAQTTSF